MYVCIKQLNVGKDFSQFQEKQVKMQFQNMVECFFAIIFFARFNQIKSSIGTGT